MVDLQRLRVVGRQQQRRYRRQRGRIIFIVIIIIITIGIIILFMNTLFHNTDYEFYNDKPKIGVDITIGSTAGSAAAAADADAEADHFDNNNNNAEIIKLNIQTSQQQQQRHNNRDKQELDREHDFAEALEYIKQDFLAESNNNGDEDKNEELKLYYCNTPSTIYKPGNNRLSILILTKKKQKQKQKNSYVIEQRIADDEGNENSDTNIIYCPAGWPCTQIEPQYKIFEACNGSVDKIVKYICETNSCWIANNGLKGCCSNNEVCSNPSNSGGGGGGVFSTTDLCHSTKIKNNI
jgi:hypothetical protein